MTQTDNRRVELRRRILKAGIIAFAGRHSTVACTVRDLSQGGARLLVAGTVSAPDTFELIIEIDGLEADCEVVGRRGSDVHVRFLSPPRQVTPRRVQVIDACTSEKPSLRRKPIRP